MAPKHSKTQPVPEPEPEPEVIDLTGDDPEDPEDPEADDPDDPDLHDLDDEDDEDLSSLGEHFDPLQQLTQLFVTEAGTPIVDVLQGIQDALDKQNKIMFKLVSVLDAKLPRS